jgi:hypothetical protein
MDERKSWNGMEWNAKREKEESICYFHASLLSSFALAAVSIFLTTLQTLPMFFLPAVLRLLGSN